MNYGAGGVPGGAQHRASPTTAARSRSTSTRARTSCSRPPTGPIVTLPGSYQSELGCPGDWAPDCLASLMADGDGDGVYKFTTDDLPAGSYEVKVAHGLSWDENYGAGGAPGGANIPFTATDGKPVTFRYTLATHVLTIEATDPPLAGTGELRAHWIDAETIAWPADLGAARRRRVVAAARVGGRHRSPSSERRGHRRRRDRPHARRRRPHRRAEGALPGARRVHRPARRRTGRMPPPSCCAGQLMVSQRGADGSAARPSPACRSRACSTTCTRSRRRRRPRRDVPRQQADLPRCGRRPPRPRRCSPGTPAPTATPRASRGDVGRGIRSLDGRRGKAASRATSTCGRSTVYAPDDR